jgi:Zn-finger nucleic acid-binding protein
MICPVCKSNMIVVERNHIELDHCGTCGGSWFDSGEIELLLASLGVTDCGTFLSDLMANVTAKTAEKARRCPVCSQKMRKSNIGEQPKVLVDVCRRGDGVWFDGGELDDFLTQLKGKPMVGPECDRKISDFLGDMLRSRIVPGKTGTRR